MVQKYKLELELKQYTCMVDLLSRAGHLNEAYNLIMAVPFVPDDHMRGSLLGSCRTYRNQKMAELVASRIFQLDSTSTGYHLLLANLYEDFGKLNRSVRIMSEIKNLGLEKQVGCSWVEVNNNFSYICR